MYDIAEQVSSWLAEGREVTVAILVAARGLSSAEPGAALARSGADMVGALAGLSGEVVAPAAAPAPLVDVTVDDDRAAEAGLACGGTLTLLVQPAAAFPPDTWNRLLAGEAVCLVATGNRVELFAPTTVRDATAFGDAVPRLFGRGVTAATTLAGGGAAIAFWPVPSVLVVGDGLIATALRAQAALLDWSASAVADVHAAVAAIETLRGSDAVVVLSHDREVDGPALAAALSGGVRYVGALGSRRTQAARREWLISHGVDEAQQRRIHGPAGLDLDAHTPAEIAVSIMAEILAERAGSSPVSLRDRSGPVHTAGVQAPPPRY